MTAPPRRVRVTSPRTSAARTRRVPPALEIDGRTTLGAVYLSSLIRAQLRLSLTVLAVVVGVVGGLPLAFRLLPGLTGTDLLGVPLPWVLLGAVVYPFLIACGWAYVRRAERNERVFATMVAPDEEGAG